jgi:hypothetical protein
MLAVAEALEADVWVRNEKSTEPVLDEFVNNMLAMADVMFMVMAGSVPERV